MAAGTAFLKAVEHFTEPEKRLFEDPYSYHFLPPMFQSMVYLMRTKWFYSWMLQVREKTTPGVLGGIYCRTRYIDDAIRKAVADGFDAVVNLGAGYDTRALRIEELSKAQIFETDHPDVIAAKKELLNKKPLFFPDYLVLVPIDFEKQDLADEMKKAGYTADLKTLFILEGITQYISPEAFSKTLRFIASTAAGSRVVFTYVLKDFIEKPERYPENKNMIKQFKMAGVTDITGIDHLELEGMLLRNNLILKEDAGAEEYQKLYLEPLNRKLNVMPIERIALAEKIGND